MIKKLSLCYPSYCISYTLEIKDRRFFKFHDGNKHAKNVIEQLAPYLECGWPRYLNILS